MSPNTGSSAGGDTVTIVGSGFTNVLGVSFGGYAASSYQVISPNEIIATTPAANVTGTVHTQVTTTAGVSPDPPGDEYTFQQSQVYYIQQPGTVQYGSLPDVYQQQMPLVYSPQAQSQMYSPASQARATVTKARARKAADSRLRCRVYVSPLHPRAMHLATVRVITSSGARILVNARFAHGNVYQRGNAGRNGQKTFAYNIGSPRFGYRVHVLVTVTNGGKHRANASLSWLPAR